MNSTLCGCPIATSGFVNHRIGCWLLVERVRREDFVVLPTTVSPSALCPDLLRYEQIGAADNLRGRVVRAFFWLMRAWPAR